MPQPNNVGVGVAILVVNAQDDEVLLLKRQGAHADGTYACPGGWIDFEDESPVDTCIRELKEEVNLTVVDKNDLILLTAVSEHHKDLGIRTVTLYYVVDCDKLQGWPRIVEPDKATELKWFKIENPPSPLFPRLAEVLKIR